MIFFYILRRLQHSTISTALLFADFKSAVSRLFGGLYRCRLVGFPRSEILHFHDSGLHSRTSIILHLFMFCLVRPTLVRRRFKIIRTVYSVLCPGGNFSSARYLYSSSHNFSHADRGSFSNRSVHFKKLFLGLRRTIASFVPYIGCLSSDICYIRPISLAVCLRT